MTDLILHGGPRSNYVRTSRLALEEKGVAYTLDPVMPQTPEQLERHPWGKIPAMTHGDVRLYEALAITRYVDEAYDGPALQPADPAGRAVMNQWISVFNAYADTPWVRHIVIQRVVADTPNEELVAGALEPAGKCIDILDARLADAPYLAGGDLTLADLFFLPALNYVSMVPEGGPLLANASNVNAWLDRLLSRDSSQVAFAA